MAGHQFLKNTTHFTCQHRTCKMCDVLQKHTEKQCENVSYELDKTQKIKAMRHGNYQLISGKLHLMGILLGVL